MEPRDMLLESTLLLSQLTPHERAHGHSDSFKSLPADVQLLRCYRAVRSQEFLARQAHAVVHKEAWIDKEFERLQPPRRVTLRAKQDEFYRRLMQDTERRAARQKAATVECMAREAAILKSSKLWALSEKLCRKP